MKGVSGNPSSDLNGDRNDAVEEITIWFIISVNLK